MLYHHYKQQGGWGVDWPDWDWPDYDCCGEIIATIDVCDFIAGTLQYVVDTIIGKPINIIINIVNIIIKILNSAINLIMKLVAQVFNLLLNLIKHPIQITNIIVDEIRILIFLILDILGGDILSIM